jgi:S1-C subfamily serine protease
MPRTAHATTAGSLVVLALLTVLVAGCSGSSGGVPGGGQPSAATVPVPAAAQDLQQTVIAVIRTVQPSVVQVNSSSSAGRAIGSGEILTSSGYIVTNDHVVSGFSAFSVTLASGKSFAATLVGAAAGDDLAVLKISAGKPLQPIAIGDSSKVAVGAFCLALGSPLGLQQSATFGIVSALDRNASEQPSGPAAELTGLIQTSAPINPGNSGGALVNLQAQLIGIPTLAAENPESGTAAAGIGFAIPSNRVKFVTDQLIKNGHLSNTGQGFLGIRAEDVTPDLASSYNLPVQSGVLVTDFANDASGKSPAQAAGIQKGDIIVAVNGQSINTSGDLSGVLTNLSPGSRVAISIVRGANRSDIQVTLGERPTTG